VLVTGVVQVAGDGIVLLFMEVLQTAGNGILEPSASLINAVIVDLHFRQAFSSPLTLNLPSTFSRNW
jgi:hypothetical protein